MPCAGSQTPPCDVSAPNRISGRSADRRPSGLALVLLVAVAVAAVLVWRLGGSGDAERYRIVLPDANQLVVGNEVQVGGRRIGSVADIDLTDDHRAVIAFDVDDEELLPLRTGSTVVVRVRSLSGLANRVLAVTPGPNTGRALRAGETLPAEDATTAVDVDQLFSTFDEPTREALREIPRGTTRVLDGRERAANRGLEQLPRALSAGRGLLRDLARRDAGLQRLLVTGSEVLGSLADDRAALSDAVGNSAATLRAIGSEDRALDATLSGLPGSLRRATRTFADVRTTLDALDPLVTASIPAARKTPALLDDLRPLARDLVPIARDAALLARGPREGDDLRELLRATPPLARAAVPALADARRSVAASKPIAAFVRPYTPDVMGYVRTFAGATAVYDANGHIAATQAILSGTTLADLPENTSRPLRGAIAALAPLLGIHDNRTTRVRRCPGSVVQRVPDGSNPFRDLDGTLDCDPLAVLPGR